jgi:SAM-dependent methyltransferase
MSYQIVNCILCGVSDQEALYIARDRHYGIAGQYVLVRCRGCSLIFINPMYSEHELSSLYPSGYYAYKDNFSKVVWKEFIRTILGLSVHTRDPQFGTPGKMLDVGCGSGWFLSEMREKGWEAYGVEPNAAAAALGCNTAGLNIFPGVLERASFPSGFFDYIRSNHSFEHISNPKETLREIYRILHPEGKLLIGVPNFDSVAAKLFGQYWWYLGAPVHAYTYSVSTLSKLLVATGFRVQRVVYNSNYGGTTGSLQLWINRKNGHLSTQGGLINNPLARAVGHWVAKVTDLFRLGDSIEVIATKAEI